MLETVWGLGGGPRCPRAASDSSAIAALISGRACGPPQTLVRTRQACFELFASVVSGSVDGPRTVAAEDANTVMLKFQIWKAEGRCS
eukprot:6481110-Lingulodinium_polyedra.AAC.1